MNTPTMFITLWGYQPKSGFLTHAIWGSFITFKFEFKYFKKNTMIYQYCNLLASKFLKQKMLYYGHSKNDLVLSSLEISSFLLVTTENLLDDKIQHFLCPCIFFGIFEIFKFKNLEVSETNLKPGYAWGFRC
jgi:hypothetical protein